MQARIQKKIIKLDSCFCRNEKEDFTASPLSGYKCVVCKNDLSFGQLRRVNSLKAFDRLRLPMAGLCGGILKNEEMQEPGRIYAKRLFRIRQTQALGGFGRLDPK